MDGWQVITNISNLISRFPVEQLMARGGNKNLERLEARLKEKGLLTSDTPGLPRPSHEANFPQGSGQVAVITVAVEQAPAATASLSAEKVIPGVTPVEILSYQKRQLGKVMYGMELHLAQKCRISGKPCDCCDKHSLLEGLAEETVPIASRLGEPTKPYQDVVDWIHSNSPKFQTAAVSSGRYDAEYPKLAGEISLLRKAITGASKAA